MSGVLDPLSLDRLIAEAKRVSRQSYSPYSKFAVGAAVIVSSGEVFAATNIENASFGLTICAERSAIFQAVAAGHRDIQGVLIYTSTNKPTAPCGACRQVINEFNPKAFVISVCDATQSIRTTLDQLLPQAFGPANLE